MKKTRVLLGLSGGVDSAVAAILLKKQGYEVIPVFLKCFSSNSKHSQPQGDCDSAKDKKDAQKVAAKLNLQLKTLNFEKEYRDLVIKPMFESYQRGLTPNPDSLCNKIIKFPLLWKAAKTLNCDFIATGHYIKKTKKKDNYILKIPKDKKKDQTYFLYDLTQHDLSHSIFPIGGAGMTKSQVREYAKKHKLPNHDKRSTRGLCFVGKINMKEFLNRKIKTRPGKIKDIKGKIIGKHQGVSFYTIGERIRDDKKTNIQHTVRNVVKKKLYVAKKIVKTNTLIVAPENSEELKRSKFRIIKPSWVSKKPIGKIKVRIRHLGELHDAHLNKNLQITLSKPIKGVAEGQSAVIYKVNTLLGGGEIRFK